MSGHRPGAVPPSFGCLWSAASALYWLGRWWRLAFCGQGPGCDCKCRDCKAAQHCTTCSKGCHVNCT